MKCVDLAHARRVAEDLREHSHSMVVYISRDVVRAIVAIIEQMVREIEFRRSEDA